jgi:hypothetical protein
MSVTYTDRRSIRHIVKKMGQVVGGLIELFYLVCLMCSPMLGLIYLTWIVAGRFWPLDLPQEELGHFSWLWDFLERKVCTFLAYFGSFVWLFYILPAPQIGQGSTRDPLEKSPRTCTLWKHAALWCVVFGPLAVLGRWYDELSWSQWALVLAWIGWAFYIEVWQDFKRRQLDYETRSVFWQLHQHFPHARRQHMPEETPTLVEIP